MNNKIAINTIYQQLNLKSKINKQAEQTHGYREHFDDCQTGTQGGWGDGQKR